MTESPTSPRGRTGKTPEHWYKAGERRPKAPPKPLPKPDAARDIRWLQEHVIALCAQEEFIRRLERLMRGKNFALACRLVFSLLPKQVETSMRPSDMSDRQIKDNANALLQRLLQNAKPITPTSSPNPQTGSDASQ